MCEYLGYQVLSLKRVRIMELTIDGLKEGEYREATQEEWKKLERGIADSSQLPAARRQDSVPVFSKKQGRLFQKALVFDVNSCIFRNCRFHGF